MADRQILLQPAYVLHQRPYRDTSALLELFSPKYGRVGVVAKGVRAAKSRWRGLLQPFQPLFLSWNLRGELGTLTGAEAQGPAMTLAPELIASGFYLNEILMRLLERHEAQWELFGCYDTTLRGMGQILAHDKSRSEELEILLRQFELKLLAALGYGLVLDHDVKTGSPVVPEQEYVYQLEYGPVPVSPGDFMENYEHGPRLIGSTLLALQHGDLSEERVRVESKRLLRWVLGHYLGPKPLQSRNLAQPVTRHQ